ncbi:MAG: ATP-binding cassette domain-containing protein, partial [Oscillospiraceae bacterium]|jgi:ABC-2 type transport system ATP-binding protein|nr:ATP-binding cassette domain-containing protein [Oscillospiraceae bacterium]
VNVITVKKLSKTYRIHQKPEGIKSTFADLFHRKYEDKAAVREIDFSVEKGSIVGLLGENGAGKTTTLKLLTGILYPTGGAVDVLGYEPARRKKGFLKKIAFVMGNKGDANWDLPAADTFAFQKLVYDIPDAAYKRNLSELSEMLDVTGLLNVQVRRLSLGERMKIELINSFIYEPEVVFLDEPTIGLDLSSQDAIRSFISEYRRKKNATVVITSHYMDDIEQTCDKVIILNRGAVTYNDSIASLMSEDVSFKDSIKGLLYKGGGA